MMRSIVAAAAVATAACTTAPAGTHNLSQIGVAATPTATRLGPAVDHHQHLLSQDAAAHEQGEGLRPVAVPTDIASLLERRAAAWNDLQTLADVYAEDAMLVEDSPISGRTAVAEYVSERFGRPYAITPLAYEGHGDSRQIAAAYTRGEGDAVTYVGLTSMTLRRGGDGAWRIASESMKFPGPVPLRELDAAGLVRLLDEAHIGRAVVMSVAYLFENLQEPIENGAARLRQENDWTASQVARYPARLVGFCSVNPLTEQAVAEIGRCATQLELSGLKLHFGNSNVDLKTPAHLERVKRVFATANAIRMPIAVHLWDSANDYGRRDAELFLAQVLPQAPDIIVQVMHMAGAGPGWTDEALEVLANAAEAGDARVKNVYFDVATVAEFQTNEQLQLLARRIRQIGPRRILYGSDGAFGGNKPPDQSWGQFRGMVPLTDAEFAIIRDNVAPYLRRSESPLSTQTGH